MKHTYVQYKKSGLQWKRPNVETIAKGMDLHFMYKFGYDYGSTKVHPMANDGQEDFDRLLDLPEKESYPDHISVLGNSFLAVLILIQEGINSGSLKWAAAAYDFLDKYLKHLEVDHFEELEILLAKVGYLHINKGLCKKRSSN